MDESRTDTYQGGVLRIPPPVLAGLLLIGTLLLHVAARPHAPRLVYPHQLLGLLLVAAGTGLSAYAAALFSAHATTKNPHGRPTAMVSEAPYTFTRNPMYVGLAIDLFGFAIFFGSPVMLIAPLLFLFLIDRMLIPQEEARMEELFSEQYLEYKRRVRRWL